MENGLLRSWHWLDANDDDWADNGNGKLFLAKYSLPCHNHSSTNGIQELELKFFLSVDCCFLFPMNSNLCQKKPEASMAGFFVPMSALIPCQFDFSIPVAIFSSTIHPNNVDKNYIPGIWCWLESVPKCLAFGTDISLADI